MADPKVRIPGEIWKPIPGFEKTHEVSNKGRVWALSKHITRKDGSKYITKAKLLKPTLNNKGKGYYNVWLSRGNYDTTFHALHRLVAYAFIPNRNNKPTVNHIDGNPQNNNVENLEWATRSEQTQHALLTGLIDYSSIDRHGINNGTTKLTERDVYIIRASKDICMQKALALLFGVSRCAIQRIQYRKAWAHLD